MKVLVACEFSGVVMDAFRKRGFDSYSCDIMKRDSTFTTKPIDKEGRYHIQCDLWKQSMSWFKQWDIMIAHPPCTYLSNAGARWTDKVRLKKQAKAIKFFMLFVSAPVRMKAIENPVGCMSSVYRKPDQYIEPWMFGHGECKRTGLWIFGLPFLRPTNRVEGRDHNIVNNFLTIHDRQDSWMTSSVTFSGIAEAMAKQWGDFALENERWKRLVRRFDEMELV